MFYNFRVKMYPCLLAYIFQYFLFCPCRTIWPVGQQCIKYIHNRKNASCKRNLLTLQTAWVPRAIPFFMVTIWDIDCLSEEGDRREYFVCYNRMFLHDFHLFIGCLLYT